MSFIKKIFREIKGFFTSGYVLKNIGLAIALVLVLLFLTFKLLDVYTHHGESITVPDFRGMTIEQAKDQLKNNKLKYEIIDSLFTEKKKPGAIIDQDPPTGSKVKQKRTIYFTVNAINPPLVSLPNIWNKPLNFATKMLEARGLKVDEENIRYRKDKAVNTVLEVIYGSETLDKPRSSSSSTDIRIPRGSALGLVVAEGSGGEVFVPKLTCFTYEEAIFKIRSSNLNIGALLADKTVIDTLSAFVYKQNPTHEEAQIIRMGEQVDIWLTQDRPIGCEDELSDEISKSDSSETKPTKGLEMKKDTSGN